MIEQVGNALLAFGLFTENRVGKTGLTVTCTVRRIVAGGGVTALVSGAAATEVGQGLYLYELGAGSVTLEGLYVFTFATAGDADQLEMSTAWAVGKAGVEHLDGNISDTAVAQAEDIAAAVWDRLTSLLVTAGSIGEYVLARLGLITSNVVTLASPVSQDGTTMSLVRGDHYDLDEDRQLTFSSDGWPDLTGVTEVRLTARHGKSRSVLFTVTDVLASRVVGAGTQTLVFELTPTETDELPLGTAVGRYDVQATLDGHILTLVLGDLTVLEDYTRPA